MRNFWTQFVVFFSLFCGDSGRYSVAKDGVLAREEGDETARSPSVLQRSHHKSEVSTKRATIAIRGGGVCSSVEDSAGMRKHKAKTVTSRRLDHHREKERGFFHRILPLVPAATLIVAAFPWNRGRDPPEDEAESTLKSSNNELKERNHGLGYAAAIGFPPNHSDGAVVALPVELKETVARGGVGPQVAPSLVDGAAALLLSRGRFWMWVKNEFGSHPLLIVGLRNGARPKL